MCDVLVPHHRIVLFAVLCIPCRPSGYSFIHPSSFLTEQDLLMLEDSAQNVRIDVVVPLLFERMERMVSRGQLGDGVFVTVVSRLLLVLALRHRGAADFLSARKAKWDGWMAVSWRVVFAS